MFIKELTMDEFTTYQKNHPLSNMYQTINYAMLMAEEGYEYDLIGLVDNDNTIKAATLILLKPIGFKTLYGYAPRGFLIDYNDKILLQTFTEKLKEYYYEKNVVFIKVNPNIPIGSLDNKSLEINHNSNNGISDTLQQIGYKKLANNLYFEALLPRFNPIIDLKNIDMKSFAKNTKNKIKKGIRKGLIFNHGTKDDIKYFYNFVSKKSNKDEYYYQDYYTVFDKNDDIDLFLVSINYDDFLHNSQYIYNEELEKNNYLNNKLANNNSEKIINAKMNSDRILLNYKNDIMEATKGFSERKIEYIAGALVVKHNDIVTIVASGFDINYKRFAPNYFLHYNIIKYYQDKYDYLDLNGVVGNFKEENPYSGLNRFKLGFNPTVYEFIGEYDLIINSKIYENLLYNGTLSKEFDKNKKLKKRTM